MERSRSATRNSGALEYAVGRQNCLLVDMRDVDAIAAAVRHLLDEPELAQSWRAGGRDTAGSHSWSAMMPAPHDTYRRVATSGPQRRTANSWRLSTGALSPTNSEVHDMLRLRLDASASSRLAVPVSWPATEGHSLVRWQVVAQRKDGNGLPTPTTPTTTTPPRSSAA